MTADQIKALVERIATVALTYAVAKGYISPENVIPYTAAIVAVAAAFYGWWVNRPKAIVQSAAALPNTVVVTTPALAADTPEKNIVSADSNKVVMK